MFPTKIAKAPTKAADSPTGKLAHQRSTLRARPLGRGAVEQLQMLQWTIGNQATLRYLTHRPAERHEQEAAPENLTTREAPRGPSWDFSKIPVFPPDRAFQPHPSSPVTPRPLPGAIQAKLAVGQLNDPLEHEADRVADQVMRMPDPAHSLSPAPPQVSRKCAECEKEDVEKQRVIKPAGPARPAGEAPPIVHEVLRSPGQPLDTETRAFFEPRFGYDFSQVRVHADDRAAESTHSVNALAFTVGSHVVLDPYRYQSASHSGRKLLSHELAHFVQNCGNAEILRREPQPPAAATPSAPARPGRIIAEFSAPDGSVVIEIEIGRGARRLGLEQTLPSATEVSLDGWQRAHQIGAGFGAESGSGIRYAPPEVNLDYQNAGIEEFIREFNKQKAPGVRLVLRTETRAHPNSLRLESITYRLSAAHGDATPSGLFEVKISISNVTKKPRITLHPPEILGNWKEFLAPGRVTEPLRPRSSKPATYSSSARTTERHEVPEPEVSYRRPPSGQQGAPEPSAARPPTVKPPSAEVSAGGAEAPALARPPTAKPPSIDVPAGAAEAAAKLPAIKPPSAEIPAGGAEPAIAEGAVAEGAGATISRAALRGILETAIFIAVDLLLRWALAKLFELEVKSDITSILEPQLAKKLDENQTKIAALRGNRKVFMRVGYGFFYNRSTDPIMGGPPFYNPGSVTLFHVAVGNEELDQKPTQGENVTEKLGLLTERVRVVIGYSVLLDDPQKQAREKQQAELLARMRRSAADAPKSVSPPPAGPAPAAPPLLAPPGVAPPPKVDLLPGAPTPSTVAEPMAVVAWLRGQMAGLLQTGEKLVGSSPSPTRAEIEAFGKAEEEWRVRATYAWNHYHDNGPDQARAAMDEILHADRQGGRLITIRQNLGLPDSTPSAPSR